MALSPPQTRIIPPEGKITVTADPVETSTQTETGIGDTEAQTSTEPSATEPGSESPPAGDAKTTADVVTRYAGAGGGEVPVEADAIRAYSSGLKSLGGNVTLAARAASQSPEAKIGAKVALENAVETHKSRWDKLKSVVGENTAQEIHNVFVRIHNLTNLDHKTALENLSPPTSAG